LEDVITVAGLTKSFGPTRALDGLDLGVRAGEVHGFLGPNGAGKTTTIRILLGLLRADSGTAEVLGGDPWMDAVALHRRLAYVPGDVTLWPTLSGGEVIDLLGRLCGGLDPKRRAELLERPHPNCAGGGRHRAPPDRIDCGRRRSRDRGARLVPAPRPRAVINRPSPTPPSRFPGGHTRCTVHRGPRARPAAPGSSPSSRP
jgi:ABC-type lipoprotein export system ATPase subunit